MIWPNKNYSKIKIHKVDTSDANKSLIDKKLYLQKQGYL
jgi:hypothetical protein